MSQLIVFVFALLLSGCSNSDAENPQNERSQEESFVYLKYTYLENFDSHEDVKNDPWYEVISVYFGNNSDHYAARGVRGIIFRAGTDQVMSMAFAGNCDAGKQLMQEITRPVSNRDDIELLELTCNSQPPVYFTLN